MEDQSGSGGQRASLEALIQEAMAPLHARIAELTAELERRSGGETPPSSFAGRSGTGPLSPQGNAPEATATAHRAVGGELPRRKPLTNPPKFSGKRREYPAWAQQMRDEIEYDRAFYQSGAEVWYLINSCLDVNPQQVVATFYALGGAGGRRDPSDFMAYLDRTYKDPNIQPRAASLIHTMRQKDNESLMTFLPKFERTLADAGGAAWPDAVQINLLEQSLSPRLRDYLITVSLPDTYPEWLSRVQEVAWKLERTQTGPRSRHEKAPTPRWDADGDIKMTGAVKVRATTKPTTEASSSSSDEDTRRCYACNKKGHIRRNCPRG
ncbi:uncharacterized protein ColSpa_12025 [Colletotrichum spaethianum]|uniref:CCHC-type domain-containing protein n=1 Tax=Colletotrichum spaethianum TaxID=700344 RepID=A0AA37PGJ8_9PEZI|nr:uncharacterized protein ColSpa_12025 [Colletotrichum spaethianum]GKT51844.1 hypothetical protein ColSpa_12025 [Colletotrichum spaethianum]